MGGILSGLGDNCEILMFIILFLLLFWDRGVVGTDVV